MTQEELESFVDGYLARHLDKEFWQGLEAEKRSAAVSMALGDVLSALPELTLEIMADTGFAVRAISEQAVFLARNYENINEGKVVTSEGISGITTSYTLLGDEPGMSFRAASLIKQAQRGLRGGTASVSRG